MHSLRPIGRIGCGFQAFALGLFIYFAFFNHIENFNPLLGGLVMTFGIGFIMQAMYDFQRGITFGGTPFTYHGKTAKIMSIFFGLIGLLIFLSGIGFMLKSF